MNKPWKVEGWDQTIFDYTFRAVYNDDLLTAEYREPAPRLVFICEYINEKGQSVGCAVEVAVKAWSRISNHQAIMSELKARLLFAVNRSRGMRGDAFMEQVR